MKGSGKTTLLKLLRHLVFRSVLWVQPSDAVMFRVHADPFVTLLIDEIDTVFGSQGSARSELRAILNSGYEDSGSVPRLGRGGVVEEYPVYGPVAFAGIGRSLPPTLESRSFVLEIWKAPPDSSLLALDVPVLRREAEWDGAHLHDRLCTFVRRAAASIAVRFVMPASIANRDAQLMRPLLAIAQHAGGDWPARARRAAECFTGTDVDPTLSVLSVVRDLFDAKACDRLSTQAIVLALNSSDHDQWSPNGAAFDAKSLAAMLAPFGIRSSNQRFPDGGQAKGYRRAQFEEVWRRYLA